MAENLKNQLDASAATAAIRNDKLRALNAAYYTTLSESVGALVAAGVIRLPYERPVRVLEIGCRDAKTLPAILAFFGRQHPANYTGIDIETPAPPSFKGIDVSNARFVTGDARDIHALLGNAEPFDVVIFRTPQVQLGVGELNITGNYDHYIPNPIFGALFDELIEN